MLMDPTVIAPDVEVLLSELFATAREKKLASLSVERLLAALLQLPAIAAYLDACLGEGRAATLRSELDSILEREPLAQDRRGAVKMALRSCLPRGLAALDRWLEPGPQASLEFSMVLSKALLRTLPRNYLKGTDILLSIIENAQGAAHGLLERHQVTRYSLARHLVHGAEPSCAGVDFSTAGGEVQMVLLDDEFTPQPFVVEVLESVFGMGTAEASETMMAVHNNGRAVCGRFTPAVAQAKMAQFEALALAHQQPLRCRIELP